MEFTKKFKAYVLIDPDTNIPRYVGITTKSIKQRFSGHLHDIYTRPTLNPHKTNWFKKLMSEGKMPIIEQIAEFDTDIEMKEFEINYIATYKEKYNLINMTQGGDGVVGREYNRESIVKSKWTKPVVQYNVLGEKIAEYEITEDIMRTYNLRNKACSHITQCCKGSRKSAYGYIWRYKDEPLGDISNINPKSLEFNVLVQYDKNWNRIAEYNSYLAASKAIGDGSKGGNIASVIMGDQISCKGFYFQVEPTYVYFDQNLFDSAYKKHKSVKKQITKNGITIDKLDLDGNYIETYNSITEASEKTYGTKNSRNKIKECLEGRESFKGYKWRVSLNAVNSENELTESTPSEAEDNSERVTTISKESTLQANGNGNTANKC